MRLLTVLLPIMRLCVLGMLALLFVRDVMRRHPEHLPWTPLVLDAPIGWATGTKLAELRGDIPRCRALLAAAGVAVRPAADLRRISRCRIADAVQVDRLGLPLLPGKVVLSCPMAAATYVWVQQVVRPAARATLGADATAIGNLGSYNCRTIAGSERLSEHATANAIDIGAIRLANGGSVAVARDWGKGSRGTFLRKIRDGGCRLFRVVLSPDYNAAHRDHLHVDLGTFGSCR